MSKEHNPPSSNNDERLKRVTLGQLTLLNDPILLREYDPEWLGQFTREADRIRSVLGARALRIEHVGSTSVPGLIAKPVVDILLVVANSADEPAYVPALQSGGYVLRIREPQWHEHRMFKSTGIDLNLHVFTGGATEIQRMLLFRDRLRDNPAERRLYAERKQQLANRSWKYLQDYADAKSEVIEAILSGQSKTRQGDKHL